MHNPAADASNQGYSLGVTFGKAGKRKTWEIGYRWKVLEENAWFEELVDSDFGAYYATAPATSGKSGSGYQAGTNVRGHVIKAAYSPSDYLTFGISYFLANTINENPSGSGSRMGRLQVDAVLKF